MKCSLGISNFLEEISSLSRCICFLCLFALLTLFTNSWRRSRTVSVACGSLWACKGADATEWTTTMARSLPPGSVLSALIWELAELFSGARCCHPDRETLSWLSSIASFPYSFTLLSALRKWSPNCIYVCLTCTQSLTFPLHSIEWRCILQCIQIFWINPREGESQIESWIIIHWSMDLKNPEKKSSPTLSYNNKKTGAYRGDMMGPRPSKWVPWPSPGLICSFSIFSFNVGILDHCDLNPKALKFINSGHL